MTIFKHFYESRGGGVATQGSEFHNYRGLHKIAFPPTHPQCRDLFLQVITCSVFLNIEILHLFFLIYNSNDNNNNNIQ